MTAKYIGSSGTTIRSVVLLVILLLGTCAFNHVYGALANTDRGTSQTELLSRMNKPMTGKPMLDQRVHKVGNMWLTVTNYGIFGNQSDPSVKDPETGLSAPSCEYPGGSGMEYLFQGALWIGAIIGEDTLVSYGHDGWQHIFEMYGDAAPQGAIIKRSTRKSDAAYDSVNAVSEADYISVYTDTLTDQAYVAINPDDGRQHIPLGVKITQKSYSWSYSYAEDFILMDFLIRNIGGNEIKKAYIGLYVDADVSHFSKGALGSQDDIAGFKQSVTSSTCSSLQDTIDVAWIADNDGDPNRSGVFDAFSVVAVTGTRVVRTPNPELKTSFNWWVSWGDDPNLDWGPVRRENSRNLGTGGLGTPAGDKNKYFFMKNGEFDYDQLYSAIDYSSAGWLPPNSAIASNLADGYDTRYLLSFGPFDIGVDDTLPLAISPEINSTSSRMISRSISMPITRTCLLRNSTTLILRPMPFGLAGFTTTRVLTRTATVSRGLRCATLALRPGQILCSIPTVMAFLIFLGHHRQRLRFCATPRRLARLQSVGTARRHKNLLIHFRI
jgi:hypothetical protein